MNTVISLDILSDKYFIQYEGFITMILFWVIDTNDYECIQYDPSNMMLSNKLKVTPCIV